MVGSMKGAMVMLAFAVAAGFAPVCSAGETVPSLRPGARVRISTVPRAAHSDWTTGTIVAVTGDSLAIQVQPESGRTIGIARASITGLEVSRGERSSWLMGLGIGFLIGAGTGGAVGATTLSQGYDLGTAGATAAGAVIGAPLGALLGMVIGSTIKSERWRKVPVTVSGLGGGQSFGYAVRVTVPLGFRTR